MPTGTASGLPFVRVILSQCVMFILVTSLVSFIKNLIHQTFKLHAQTTLGVETGEAESNRLPEMPSPGCPTRIKSHNLPVPL